MVRAATHAVQDLDASIRGTVTNHLLLDLSPSEGTALLRDLRAGNVTLGTTNPGHVPLTRADHSVIKLEQLADRFDSQVGPSGRPTFRGVFSSPQAASDALEQLGEDAVNVVAQGEALYIRSTSQQLVEQTIPWYVW